VVVTGKPVNHVLHLLLSLFLCAMWVPVWLIMAAVGGEIVPPLTASRIVPIVLAALLGGCSF
jgi:hypothetical protein